MRLFCEPTLAEFIKPRRILQINHSKTNCLGAIRGLHFQRNSSAEMKLVRCLAGKVWDVAVDLRTNSPTFLQWHGEELSPLNRSMMIIPEGFAHGFQVLEPASQMLYLHTELYNAEHESGIRFDDPAIDIQWPLTTTDISARDLNHPLLDSTFEGLVT